MSSWIRFAKVVALTGGSIVALVLLAGGGYLVYRWIDKTQRLAENAQIELSGRVYDEATGAPIEGAYVIVRLMTFTAGPGLIKMNGRSGCHPGSATVRTGADGRYRFFIDFEKEGLRIPYAVSPELRVYAPGRQYGKAIDGWFWYFADERRDFPLRQTDQAVAEREEWLRLLLVNDCSGEPGRDRGAEALFTAVLAEAAESYCTAGEGMPENDFPARSSFLDSSIGRLRDARRRAADLPWLTAKDGDNDVLRFRAIWRQAPILYDDLAPPTPQSRIPAKTKSLLCIELTRVLQRQVAP